MTAAVHIHRQLHYQILRGLAPPDTTVHVLDHAVTAALQNSGNAAVNGVCEGE